MLAVYVTGHGSGHAARTAAVLERLVVRRPDVGVIVRGRLPTWVAEGLPPSVHVAPATVDVGVAQLDGLRIDLEASLERLDAFEAGFEARVDEERRWLRNVGATVVLGDVPPLAFAAAEAARLPSIAMANFSWDWIYAHYARADSRFTRHAERARACAAATGMLLALPFHGDLAAFPRRTDVPLVGYRVSGTREEARRRVGLDPGRPLVLLQFGPYGAGEIDLRALGRLDDVAFVTLEDLGPAPPNVTRFSPDRSRGYDLFRGADVVITKPGYGVVAGALLNGVRVLHTSRGDFPEAPVLVEALERFGVAAFLSPDRLRAGDVEAPLRALLDRRVERTSLAGDGVEVVAGMLDEALG